MKLHLLLFILIYSFTNGQIKEMENIQKELIGSFKEMGTEKIKLERWDDDYIVFFYRDEKFKQISEYKSFDFKDENGALDLLYNALLTGIQAKEKSEKSLELPNDILRLKFGKTMGTGYVEIFVQNKNVPNIIGQVIWMDEKRLNKVFGKK